MLSDERAYTIITQDGFTEHFPNDQFQTFEQYAAHFNPQQQTFPGPPTPPNHHPAVVHNGQPQQLQQGLNGTNGTAAIKPPSSDVLSAAMTKSEPNADLEQSRRQGSNSDDEELTPAQSRRKAQNRAA